MRYTNKVIIIIIIIFDAIELLFDLGLVILGWTGLRLRLQFRFAG